jgi:peroxiredoxin
VIRPTWLETLTMRRSHWLRPAVLVLMSLLLVSGCSSRGGVGIQKGDVAPDFSLSMLDGGAQNLRDFRGQVVVLNFWASWCSPCRAETPDLQVTYTELRDKGLVVLGVNQGEPHERVRDFVEEFGLSYPILLDEGQTVAQKYGVRAFPTSFVIGGDGVIREVVVGALTRSAIHRQVEGLLE